MAEKYTVLARKYRSQDFDSLIGQDVLVKTITNAINSERIAHAYIFTGIRGTGKTSTARIFAKALNCLSFDKATSKPCGICENCRSISSGQHIDVLEIDAASHTGVESIRDILDTVQYKPTNARYKVYIIDEVHMLSTSAFNALLKTLEEPPEHVIFILATTEIKKVPVTILSRCQRFDLARVSVEVLKNHFLKIASLENIELSDSAAELLAYASDGSVRDGLSMLDQSIAQTAGHVDEKSVLNMLKRTDRGAVIDLMESLLSLDTEVVLNKVDLLYSSGTDLSMLINDMLEFVHWATIMHPSLKISSIKNSPYSIDQKKQIDDINSKTTLNTLSRIWQILISGIQEMQISNNQKQCFDMLMIRLIYISKLPPVSEIVKSIDSNESVMIQKKNTEKKLEKDDKKIITSATEFAERLHDSKDILLYSYYTKNIEISSFSDGKIEFFDRKGDSDFVSKLSKWLFDNTGKTWVIEHKDISENKETVVEKIKNDLSSDPLVAKAMSLFPGVEVVEVTE